MKKFLTVLLALSVVFTYSFSAVGSVFAADRSEAEYLADLAKAEESVLSDLASEYALAKAQVTHSGNVSYTGGSYVIAVTEWLKQLDVLYAATQKAVKDKTISLQTQSEYATNKADDVVLKDLYNDVTKNANGLTTDLYAAEGSYALEAAKVQFGADKAAYIANAKTVDTSIYTTTEQDSDYAAITTPIKVDANKNPKAYADAVVAGVVAALESVKIETEDDSAAKVAAKYTDLGTIFNGYIEKVSEKYILVEGKSGRPDLKSLIEEQNDNALSAATKASLRADLAAKIAEASKNPTVIGYTANAEQYAAWCKARDAYNEVMNYLIDNDKTFAAVEDFPTVTVAKDAKGAYVATETGTNYQAVVASVEKIKADAAEKKAKTNLDGKPMYDEKDVDDALKTALNTEYAKYKDATYTPVVELTVAALTYNTSFTKLNKKAIVDDKVDAEAMKYNNVEYYSVEWAKVTEAVNAYKSAVDAAETSADIAKADSDLSAAIAKINNKAAVEALFTTGGDDSLIEITDAIHSQLEAYAEYINTGRQAGTTQITSPFANKADLIKWLADKGARTAAEARALYNAAKAEIDKTPTDGQKAENSAAAVAAVKALIDNLPSPLTATKEATDATIAAKKAYAKLTTAEQSAVATADKNKLDAVGNAIAALYDADITAKYAEIQKGGITVADIPLIEDVKELNAVYKELKDNGADATDYANAVTNTAAAIRTAELNAVKAAIAAIPANVKLEDKEAVKAARKAYDDYVAKYTDYLDSVNGNASADVETGALDMAEAILKTLETKAVEGLKITASSSAKKGSITVKWTVKGDATAADGYEVFRSVKRNSGFTNKAFYTTDKNTKKSYKNTKSLKKGTRYYYKVRAYKVLADGTKVYSDWSNKAYRVAK